MLRGRGCTLGWKSGATEFGGTPTERTAVKQRERPFNMHTARMC